MRHARVITEEQEKQIVALYRSGTTQRELAEQFGLSQSGVQNVVRRNGASAPRFGRRPRFDVEQMKRMYEEGKSLQEIADLLGMHNTSVWGYLKRAGVQCRPAGFQRGEDHVGWKGGRVMTSGGYVMVRIYPDHPFFCMATEKVDGASYVLEHRFVMAQELGRPLTEEETVHHKDGDKTNNHHSNLQLRRSRHGKGSSFVCADCGSHNVVPAGIV